MTGNDRPEAADDELAILELPRERVARVFAFRHWLLSAAREIDDTARIVAGVGGGLVELGVPLARMATIVEVRHSERAGVARVWEPEAGPREVFVAHGEASRAAFEASPFAAAHLTGGWIRFDPRGVGDDAYPVVAELRGAGFTDYVCVPVPGAGGMRNGFSFASRRNGGFSADDMAVLRFAMPALAALMELLAIRRILGEVARIYLGAEPAKRVLSGDVERGNVMVMRSVIMFADMRRFTDTSMELTPKETVDLLNHYYDCVVAPVETRGGEVLKFIADGLLAIFHADPGGEEKAARDAWSASLEALDRVAALNAAGTAPAPFEVGIGLHFGDAGYGNVGSGERQDYTVIGRDVNIAARVAAMCGPLTRPLVFSAALAGHLGPGEVRLIGWYPLKGVPGDNALYEPARGTRADAADEMVAGADGSGGTGGAVRNGSRGRTSS